MLVYFYGGTALACAVYMGANKLDTVKALLDAGTDLHYRTHGGGIVLTNAIENEDSDPEVIRLVLKKLKSSCNGDVAKFHELLNYNLKPTTFKWKCMRFVAKALYRTGLAKSGLLGFLAINSGTTPLNFAVMRGDVEIVKILLENGANPFVKNDLGMNTFKICGRCGPYRNVMEVLLKKKEKEKDDVNR